MGAENRPGKSREAVKSLERDFASRKGEPRDPCLASSDSPPSCVRVDELIDAAWEALVTGRPRELIRLERMLERPLAGAPAAGSRDSLNRLEMLLAATARNLRVMRGQCQV